MCVYYRAQPTPSILEGAQCRARALSLLKLAGSDYLLTRSVLGPFFAKCTAVPTQSDDMSVDQTGLTISLVLQCPTNWSTLRSVLPGRARRGGDRGRVDRGRLPGWAAPNHVRCAHRAARES